MRTGDIFVFHEREMRVTKVDGNKFFFEPVHMTPIDRVSQKLSAIEARQRREKEGEE